MNAMSIIAVSTAAVGIAAFALMPLSPSDHFVFGSGDCKIRVDFVNYQTTEQREIIDAFVLACGATS